MKKPSKAQTSKTPYVGKEFVYRSRLREKFGLTPSMIKRIGEPDKTVPNPHYKSGPPGALYNVKRIKRWIARHRDEVGKAQERRSRSVEPRPCDLLAAVFAVNRAAKRHRDAAQRQWKAENYGLASSAKTHKEYLYALKDRGIAAAYLLGRIAPEQIHGGLCVYRGEGYWFHSSLLPTGTCFPHSTTDVPVTIEAKPQGSSEPLQRDAIATLKELPEVDMSNFAKLEVPRVVRQRPANRTVICRSCGEEGHIARECHYESGDDDECEN